MTDTMTPDEAIRWLMDNDNSLPDSYGRIMSAQLRYENAPLNTPTRQEYQGQLNREVAKVQAAKDAQDAGLEVDPAFASPSCDCEAGEPCCLKAFELRDNKKANRKVSWPLAEGASDTLFVVTKDPHGGSPSAKVDVVLTDYQPCQLGKDLPGIIQNDFVDTPARFRPDKTQTLVTTTPFALPSILSAILPADVLTAIYMAGYYTLASAYRGSDRPGVRPDACMLTNSGVLRVHPIPHMSLKASLAGSAEVTFYVRRLPTTSCALTGTLEGEFGSQKLSYSNKTSMSVSQAKSGGDQEVKNGFLAVIAKIMDRVSWMAESDAKGYGATTSGLPSASTSLKVALELTVTIGQMSLAGKDASPDLQLSLNPLTLRQQLTVTGTLDLVELLISRVPGISDARAALAREGNILQAKLECALTLSASGGAEFGMPDEAVVTISAKDGWEAELARLSGRFQADAKIIGKLEASARIGIDTWFFDGAAGASGSVSTGWHFGGRSTRRGSGESVQETLYYFEGLVLKGRYYVTAGGKVSDSSSATFDTMSPSTSGKTTTETTIDNGTRLIDRNFTARFFASEGGPDNWKQV